VHKLDLVQRYIEYQKYPALKIRDSLLTSSSISQEARMKQIRFLLLFCFFCLTPELVIFTDAMAGQTWTDLAYASVSPAQKLDIYLPDGESPFPVVLWIHGGGWSRGDKAIQQTDPQMTLLQRGYAIVSVNYRFSDEAIFPAQIQDVKAALRWIRAHADEYQLDPNRIAAWGSSAGGHLAALLGTSDGIWDLQDAGLGNSEFSTEVRAVVDWFGPNDFLLLDPQLAENGYPRTPEKGHNNINSSESKLLGAPITERTDLVERANPIHYVTSKAPPFFLEHGTMDKSVPHQQSQMLYDALVKAIGKRKVKIRFLPTGHGASSPSDPFNDPYNIGLVIEFLDRWMK
jgi:acetyl esterase/lipase